MAGHSLEAADLHMQVTEQIKNQQDDEDEAEATATAGRATVSEAATAEEENQNHDDEDERHKIRLGRCLDGSVLMNRVSTSGRPSNLRRFSSLGP